MKKLSMFAEKQFVFITSIFVACFVIVYGYLYSSKLSEVSGNIMSYVSETFGWLYVAAVFFFIVFLAWLAFGRYGNIRLGKNDESPQYSTFSWFAMLFCGSTGIGLVFWSIAEPLSHFVSPAYGMQAGTEDTMEWSIRTVFLHWGITQWACFAVVGLGLAYFQHRKGKTGQISNLLTPLVGEKATNGFFGKLVDVFSVVVSFAGVATSLGLGCTQICGGLNYLFGIPNNKRIWLWVIVVITCVFLASAISGVDKGIKLLSSINTYLALALLAIAFLVGPKIRILDTLVNGMGQHIQNMVADVLMINATGDRTWIMNWRVFYYAWFIAWTPFVGLFIAVISKGRTIKEFILGVVAAPSLFTIVWLSVFGTIAFDATEGYSLQEIARLVASPETAVFIVFEKYPLARLMSLMVISLLAIFFITSADSATYSLGMMTSDGNLNPPKYKKVVWAIVEAAIAYILLSAGSLKPLQTASIAASLPFLFIMIAMCPALLKELKKEMVDTHK